MTSARHWAVLVLALLVACPPSSAEAEPKAEAAAEAKPVYDANADTRSSSRFGGSRSLNLGLTRDGDYQTRAGLGLSGANQFGTTNQFGLNSQLGSTGYQADQFGTDRFRGSNLVGTSQFGTSGLRSNQYDTNHFGAGGLGSSQFGTSGLRSNQYDTNHFGAGGLGSSQFGTTRSVANRYGAGGIGSSQFGTSRFGTDQIGTGGLATSRFGASGLTSNNRIGTNPFGATGLRNSQFGSNQFGTTGFGGASSQFGTSGYRSNQLGANRLGSSQLNQNSLHSGLTTDGGFLNHRSENDGAGQYSFAQQGLVDNFGNVLTDRQNQFQTSNLHNLVSQNRNGFGTGGRSSGSSNYAGVGGFNRNNPAGFGSLGYTAPISSGGLHGRQKYD